MIRIVNLINGEQLIGVVEESSNSYKITNPFYIIDAINNEGFVGSKLTNVLTFSPSEYIMVDKSKIVFDFEASKQMCVYYERLVSMYDKQIADDVINEAIGEMNQTEKRYQQFMDMIRPDKTKLN
jgi:hypothetical protein